LRPPESTRRELIAGFGGIALASPPLAARAQGYPNKLIEVPTMIESGLPAVTVVTHYGILGPAGMPAEALGRLNKEVNEILSAADLKANMVKVGFEPVDGSPRDFATLIASDLQKWAPIVKTTAFQME
jgi:tripartite-type tricarboxylate transporter receptor subunit TctC